jgi:ligand-binding SRPBCC domain-containing protein
VSCIELELFVEAPIERVFDLARDVDAHMASTPGTEERAVSGKTRGLLALGDEVTWEARHFGVLQRLTSRITAFDRPLHFRDSMVKGAFRRFDHDHFFEAEGSGTRCRDLFDFDAPLGPLGWLAERLVLERYMRRFLATRMRVLKDMAERAWRTST